MIFRKYVGPVREEGDPAEAFGLALRAQHSARGVEAHQLGVGRRADLDFGLNRRLARRKIDDELRIFEPPLAVLAIDTNREELQVASVELQRAVMVAVALDRQRGADVRPLRIEIEFEADFRDQPIGRAIILAAYCDVLRGEGCFGSGLGVWERCEHRP